MEFNRFGKIQAGALQFATFISVIIALLLGAFLLISFTQMYFSKRNSFQLESIRLSSEAITLIKKDGLEYGEEVSLIHLNAELGSVVGIKSHWGIFDIVKTEATVGNTSHKKVAMLGGQIPTKKRPALYLLNLAEPLVVVGKTKVTGNCFLPELGVKAGNIRGNYYQNNELIFGSVKTSGSSLPYIDNAKRDYFINLLSTYPYVADSLMISPSPFLNEIHTFQKEPKYIYSKESIYLDEVVLENNIIVKSDVFIRISANAKLKNIIVVAPAIEIASNFEGNIQVIAESKIVLEENVSLKYPSSVLISEPKKRNKKDIDGQDVTRLIVKQGALVEGSVLYLSKENNYSPQREIIFEENSVLFGELYCDKSVELKGRIEGSAYVNRFVTKHEGSLYRNYLFDAIIDVNGFPDKFCGLQTNLTTKEIVQWVY